jgi:eukaryotic-like serine/threonine-protein kinase
MRQGEVVAGRFELKRRVGSGGMGEVYRALDRDSGEVVAVKVLHGKHASDSARFMREAEVLAELSHPGIVRYVAHGTAASGEPYMTMEWLAGEDLGERLQRAPLTVEETVTLVARAAEALAAVHARGVVHRDLKPSNLFLVERDVAQVKLLDFGIAWLPSRTRMTQTGSFIGTPGYMAPEQARSEAQLDARADVFALGCVLFECLSGRPAFTGVHFMAILGKILFDEVPRLRESCPAMPAALDALCAAMLAKQPEERPRDGAEVAAALAHLKGLPTVEAPVPTVLRPAVLTQKQRRVLSVLLMAPAPPEDGAAPGDMETRRVSLPKDLRRAMEARGGHLELLADGSIMITVVGAGVATDQATQAARCALALRAELSGRPVALATGRTEISERVPAGALIDRAAHMLTELGQALCAALASGRAAPIAIDEVTAGLLDARFEVTETNAGLWLQGEHALGVEARRLLGKPTPCVGRDTELGMLMAFFAECVDEPMARAVLVTAPAGMGKTRLAQELLRRLQQREAPIAFWIGRGDPLRSDAAFGLLGQALASAFGLKDGEPVEMRRDKLLARVAEHVSPEDARRVAEFLGEIVGTPFPEEESLPLSAARKDAQLMGDQMRRAWVDYLDALCSTGPVLLVLEDLHWGDVPTVQFVDEALRRIEDKPWMVLGLARPEVRERFPKLWAKRNVQEIRLGELSRKASARLVRLVLGEGVSAEGVERLVAHADGNAFYLEELIRTAAEGRREALPETVLSMLQGRLETLDAEARWVLRAASVFGQTFWRGAVLALLGNGVDLSALSEHLEQLERLEWIYARPEAQFQGERELCFRHALVREAAYGMLIDEDRALGHRLAGAWLTQASEPSAAVIAEHFERGGDPARAASGYQRAAAQALSANDFGAVLSCAERALALGASGEARGELALLLAEALRWRGELAEAGRWAGEALSALPVGSSAWYTAVGEAAWVALSLGQPERLAVLTDMLAAAWSEKETTGAAVVATAWTAYRLFLAGLPERAEALHIRIETVAPRFSGDPAVTACVVLERNLHERLVGNVGGSRALVEAAIQSFEQAGDLRNACVARFSLGYTECLLGAYAEAATLLRAALADAERMGLENILAHARHNLGLALGGLGALAEAREAEMRAITTFMAEGNRRLEGGSRIYLARILRLTGELEAGEAEARRALELLAGVKPLQAVARGTLADLLLGRERPVEALAEAREAMAVLTSLSKIDDDEEIVRLAYAEALEATGDRMAARAAIAEARERVLAKATRIEEPSRRKTFLENMRENARTLSLARAWLGEPAGALP